MVSRCRLLIFLFAVRWRSLGHRASRKGSSSMMTADSLFRSNPLLPLPTVLNSTALGTPLVAGLKVSCIQVTFR
jgi:hypothetical protein